MLSPRLLQVLRRYAKAARPTEYFHSDPQPGNLHFHPHLHCVVPGGGLSPDRQRWIAPLAR
jgi:hypothetical protein